MIYPYPFQYATIGQPTTVSPDPASLTVDQLFQEIQRRLASGANADEAEVSTYGRELERRLPFRLLPGGPGATHRYQIWLGGWLYRQPSRWSPPTTGQAPAPAPGPLTPYPLHPVFVLEGPQGSPPGIDDHVFGVIEGFLSYRPQTGARYIAIFADGSQTPYLFLVLSASGRPQPGPVQPFPVPGRPVGYGYETQRPIQVSGIGQMTAPFRPIEVTATAPMSPSGLHPLSRTATCVIPRCHGVTNAENYVVSGDVVEVREFPDARGYIVVRGVDRASGREFLAYMHARSFRMNPPAVRFPPRRGSVLR